MIYLGVGMGSLFSFGMVVIGLGATFMRGIAQNYGLLIIPNLASTDKRCGFEVVRRFFNYLYIVAFIGCILCYLVGIQNLYLRSAHENIFAFLTPDVGAFANAANWRDSIDALFGFLFSENVGKGTRNVYVWVFGFFIFGLFIGGFMLFLKQGAASEKAAIIGEIGDSGLERLGRLTS